MIEVIEQVEAVNIVLIVIDNGSNFKKTGSKIMKKYEIYWTPYAAHYIDLMLKNFEKAKLVEKTVCKT